MAELYTLMVDGKPVAYAYGEEWVAMGLYMDDIKFKTPEEAKAKIGDNAADIMADVLQIENYDSKNKKGLCYYKKSI